MTTSSLHIKTDSILAVFFVAILGFIAGVVYLNIAASDGQPILIVAAIAADWCWEISALAFFLLFAGEYIEEIADWIEENFKGRSSSNRPKSF